ncbi:MAG TPA: pilin [Candidatus Saccharimonadales bacterium]|nr:pilin [Candidatus Saccharimonadales bacterium]
MKRLVMLAVMALSTVVVAWCMQTGVASATDVFSDVCKAGGKGSAACDKTNDDIVTNTVSKVTNFVTFLSGIIAVIMIMVGGYMYLTSNGDTGKATEARNTITFTLIGIAVVMLARYIILFVLQRV